jgi:hypothetical protein
MEICRVINIKLFLFLYLKSYIMSERKTVMLKGNVEKEKPKGKIYTREEIREMLKDYTEVRVRDIDRIPLRVRVRYEDNEKFKAGGLLLSVDESKIFLSSNIKWNVLKCNIKRIWMQDLNKLNERKEREEKEREDGIELLEGYKSGIVKVYENEREKSKVDILIEKYKEGKVLILESKEEKEELKKLLNNIKSGKYVLRRV